MIPAGDVRINQRRLTKGIPLSQLPNETAIVWGCLSCVAYLFWWNSYTRLRVEYNKACTHLVALIHPLVILLHRYIFSNRNAGLSATTGLASVTKYWVCPSHCCCPEWESVQSFPRLSVIRGLLMKCRPSSTIIVIEEHLNSAACVSPPTCGDGYCMCT